MNNRTLWQPGSLWQKLKAQSIHGLKVGALRPIETQAEYVEDGGVRFLIHVLANLSLKEKARKQQGKLAPANPFLPYDPDLYVTDISATHLCLLNKFNVVDHHFLIVTREYEPQTNWLTYGDFEAIAHCLAELNGLVFFNGGTVAGASQPHKHMQVIPRADADSDIVFPIEPIIQSASTETACSASLLPFRHAILSLENSFFKQAADGITNIESRAEHYLSCYHTLLNAVGITSDPQGSETHWRGVQSAPYNFICTRHWMMIVPRSQEKHAGISVNSLGFVGSLLVKDQTTLEQLKAMGPLNLICSVGC